MTLKELLSVEIVSMISIQGSDSYESFTGFQETLLATDWLPMNANVEKIRLDLYGVEVIIDECIPRFNRVVPTKTHDIEDCHRGKINHN